jgi:hypothetical protein
LVLRDGNEQKQDRHKNDTIPYDNEINGKDYEAMKMMSE